MAFYRRTRRTYTRRSAKRSGYRTFSRYSTYRHRSSKAQAYQIYALNRKVQRIQRLTRPETQIRNGTLTDVISGGASIFDLTPLVTRVEDPESGVTTGDFNGNFARLNSLTYYGTAVLSAPIANTLQPRQFRIVIVQTKTTRSDDLEPGDIIRSDLDDGPLVINGPLSDGTARVAKVLSDKKYTLSFQRPIVSIKTKLKYLRNYYLDPNDTEAIAKGKIYAIIYLEPIVAGGTAVRINHGYKLAFTDA